jgi:hypothetical protein
MYDTNSNAFWSVTYYAEKKQKEGRQLSAAQHNVLLWDRVWREFDKDWQKIMQHCLWQPAPDAHLFSEEEETVAPPEGLNEQPDVRLRLLRYVREPMAC